MRLQGDTLWLSLQQLSDLFGRDKSVVSRHLKKIFDTNELRRDSVVAKNATTAADGKVYQVEYFNLDAIISVGYRVNSRQATRFRQWGTRVLRAHLTHGYSLNEYRLTQQGLTELEQAVDLLGQTLTRQALVTGLGREVVGLILGYARTWRLLRDYDEGQLGVPAGAQPARRGQRTVCLRPGRRARDYPQHYRADHVWGSAVQNPRGACHLLYFVIKNHPFADGNKRSGAFLFLLYLRQEGMRLTLDENGLTALTLLIAESDTEDERLAATVSPMVCAGTGQTGRLDSVWRERPASKPPLVTMSVCPVAGACVHV